MSEHAQPSPELDDDEFGLMADVRAESGLTQSRIAQLDEQLRVIRTKSGGRVYRMTIVRAYLAARAAKREAGR